MQIIQIAIKILFSGGIKSYVKTESSRYGEQNGWRREEHHRVQLGRGPRGPGKAYAAPGRWPQGDLTKMLGLRQPHDLKQSLAAVMNDVVEDIN